MSFAESTAQTSTREIDPLFNELLEQRDKFLASVNARVSDPATAEDILQAAYTVPRPSKPFTSVTMLG